VAVTEEFEKRGHGKLTWIASIGRGWKIAIGCGVFAVVVAVTLVVMLRPRVHRPISLLGTVLRQDSDPRKQLPIRDVTVTATDGFTAGPIQSNSAGFFNLELRPSIKAGHTVTLHFRHPDYKPLDMTQTVGDGIYIARLIPLPRATPAQLNHPEVVISNVLARYSMKTTSAVNVGSAVKTFQVVNTGNVPCHGQSPCSPGGKWKATQGSESLDAGEGNEFRNARISCIAGPCPFTKIEADGFSAGGRTISVSVLNWSDTTTFLMEAEVFRTMVNDVTRQSYPVIFGQALNFTLPATAEGVSIEAELNGESVVFPLGPALILSWANCSNTTMNRDQTTAYRCVLKTGYRFR
jgi:hypothetical protein